MITEKDIENTLNRLGKIDDTVFVQDYKDTMLDQGNIFRFIVDTFEQFNIQNDSRNACTELIYNIFKIYKDKYDKDYPIVSEETLINVLKDRNSREEKQMDILGITDNQINKNAENIFMEVNNAIKSGTTEKLTGKAKEFFEFVHNQNNQVPQKDLMEYVAYFIGNDELIAENDKPMLNMVVETIIIAMENERGE